jgi:hypothetical protein
MVIRRTKQRQDLFKQYGVEKNRKTMANWIIRCAGQCAVGFLHGYTGHMQVDGYKAYEQT